jgi:hypothetical protein
MVSQGSPPQYAYARGDALIGQERPASRCPVEWLTDARELSDFVSERDLKRRESSQRRTLFKSLRPQQDCRATFRCAKADVANSNGKPAHFIPHRTWAMRSLGSPSQSDFRGVVAGGSSFLRATKGCRGCLRTPFAHVAWSSQPRSRRARIPGALRRRPLSGSAVSSCCPALVGKTFEDFFRR